MFPRIRRKKTGSLIADCLSKSKKRELISESILSLVFVVLTICLKKLSGATNTHSHIRSIIDFLLFFVLYIVSSFESHSVLSSAIFLFSFLLFSFAFFTFHSSSSSSSSFFFFSSSPFPLRSQCQKRLR